MQEPTAAEVAIIAGMGIADIRTPPPEWTSYLFPVGHVAMRDDTCYFSKHLFALSSQISLGACASMDSHQAPLHRQGQMPLVSARDGSLI